MIQDYQNCCRLCLSTDQTHMLPSIFSQDVTEKMIAPKILYCYSLFIFPQDPFSKQLCLRCLFNLEQLWTFKQKSVINNTKLFKVLSSDPTIKCSEQYIKSIDNASKTTTIHAILSCKTPDEIAQVYHRYESLIDFSWKVEDVEIIDIVSDDESDSKKLVQKCIQRNSITPLNSNFSKEVANRNHDGPFINISSPKESDRNNFSDDAHSTPSGRTSRSKNCVKGNTIEQNHKNQLSQLNKSLVIDQNSNLENLRKTRKRQQTSFEDEVPAKNRSDLRNLRPLFRKNGKSEEPLIQRRSRSNSNDNDADSFGSMESLSTIDSDILTSSRKKSGTLLTLERVPEKILGTNKEQKLNGQLSIQHRSSVRAKRPRELENEEKDQAPSAKKRKSSESQNSETSNMTVASPFIDSNLYSCKYCAKTFKLKINKKHHLKKCPDKKIINCKYCLKRIYREEDLYKHHLRHLSVDIISIPNNRYRCNDCDRYFHPKSALKKHKKLHQLLPVPETVKSGSSSGNNEKMLNESEIEAEAGMEKLSNGCDRFATVCDDTNCRDIHSKRTRSKVGLPLKNIDFTVKQPKSQGLNMETSAEYVNNFCKYCHDVFKDDKELWKHMQIFHKWVDLNSSIKSDLSEINSNYKCTFENCTKKFDELQDLVLHSQAHIPLKCSYCQFLTHNFSSFLRHSNECWNPKNLEKSNHVRCCNKKFTKAFNFYFHKIYDCGLNKISPNIWNPVEMRAAKQDEKCGICSKNVGPGSEELLVHLIRHAYSNCDAKRPILETKQLNTDQAMFLRIFGLRSKDWTKENQSDSFECSECKDSFLSLQTFQEHRRKCFILTCTECRLNFSSNLNFIVHKCIARCKLCLTQLDDTRHMCLVRKIIITAPNKRYRCSICNVFLYDLSVCRKHILRHFPSSSAVWQENIECQICSEKLSNQLTLDVHYYLKHTASPQNRSKSMLRKTLSKKKEKTALANAKTEIIDERISSKITSSKVELNKKLRNGDCLSLQTYQNSNRNDSEKSETNQESVTISSSIGYQMLTSSVTSDQQPNSDKGLKLYNATSLNCNPTKDNDGTPSKSSGSLLSSPNYKIGDKDWSWNIVCPSVSPILSNAQPESNALSS